MKPILLALTLTACMPAQQSTPSGPDGGRYTTIEVEGVGLPPEVGVLDDPAFASSTGLCEAAGWYVVATPSVRLGFLTSMVDFTSTLPMETDNNAAIGSRVTLPDGRVGVLASGSAQITDNGDTILFTLTGSRWCELEFDPVVERDIISTCADEEIEVSYTVTVTDARGRWGLSCTQEAGLVNDEGLCTSRAEPPRCVGDPIPAPLY